MKYDRINHIVLDKIEDDMLSCLAIGMEPKEFEHLMNLRWTFPIGTADWFFMIYSLRFWYNRSLTGSEYWELNELREEMIQRFVPNDGLYEVARRDMLWIV